MTVAVGTNVTVPPGCARPAGFTLADLPALCRAIDEFQDRLARSGLPMEPVDGPTLRDMVARRTQHHLWARNYFRARTAHLDVAGTTPSIGNLTVDHVVVAPDSGVGLIGFEGGHLAPAAWDHTTMLLSLFEQRHPDFGAYLALGLHDLDCLAFAAAMSVTYHAWQFGDDAGRARVFAYDRMLNLARQQRWPEPVPA